MSFKETYEIYRNVKREEIDTLFLTLNDHLKKSKSVLFEYLNSNDRMDEKTKYLIYELLEDKEHLDAFQAAVMKKTY
ncbi:hypothetical protein [Romboutsia sp. 1001713B170207_170306_H8]|uniref:hypothetical protein n=1 Tax=Romboutsia sp. 1001713B170207_170306_H8 TaxID=2787112 RepID=UPI00189B15C3|nr:hypothetical protein [Romboutsia sp. 1001713B170207_170306_H8]